MTDWNRWAQRRTGRGGPPADPVERVAPPPPAAPALPECPPGYGWMQHPQFGLIMVLLQPTIPAPPRQPTGVVPFVPQRPAFAQPPVAPGVPARVIPQPVTSTNVLVKPGNRDTYAELLETIPDLAPASGYDAMSGNPDPAVARELAGLPEYRMTEGDPTAPTRSFPEQGRGAPVQQASALGNGVPRE